MNGGNSNKSLSGIDGAVQATHCARFDIHGDQGRSNFPLEPKAVLEIKTQTERKTFYTSAHHHPKPPQPGKHRVVYHLIYNPRFLFKIEKEG